MEHCYFQMWTGFDGYAQAYMLVRQWDWFHTSISINSHLEPLH